MIKKTDDVTKEAPWDETIRTLVVAVVLALVFRSFLFEPFHIPSASMQNTLQIGDYIFVSKSSYGYSRYSFPLGLPLFEGRVWEDMPERGDVVVFRPPQTPQIDFIKRVIGLPGDKIQMIEGALHINGAAIQRERLEDAQMRTQYGSMENITRYREVMDNGASYVTLDLTPHGGADNTGIYEVPEGHYFMMGDNRDNSTDSRAESIGFIPHDNLVGKAQMIFFSVGENARFWQIWKYFTGGLRGGRFFVDIDTFDDPERAE